MSYDTKKDTITVNDVTYDVKREPDRGGGGEETLRVFDFDVEADEFVDAFPGLSATLGYEEDGSFANPREWSNVGVMAVSYRGYNLGDEDISKIDFDHYDEDKDEYTLLNPVDYFKRERGARVVLGLTVYEHSGITMSAGDVTFAFDSDRWDTSFVGFIYDTPEKVKECIGDDATDDQIKAALESEVKVYASYLEGDVTYYVVEDEETNFAESCGGYVGDSDYCESECFSSLETAIVKRLAEIKEKAHWAARDTITT